MRVLPEISKIINKGDFFGENKAHGRVTIEPYWHLRTTGESYGLSGKGPYRWYQHTNNRQFEIEIPNIKTIEIDRSVQQDVATCNISIYNQWHRLNSEILSGNALDQLGDPGHFWYERGNNPVASQRWGQEESLGAIDKNGVSHPDFSWKNVIIPNGLIRTYQGYGGHGGSVQDAIDSGNIAITGVWLIDSVVTGTDGMLNIRCRDIGRLLQEQTTFPPLVPEDHYPLLYYPAGTSPFASKWGPQHRFDQKNRTEKGRRSQIRAAYHDSTVDHWAVSLGQTVTASRWGTDTHFNAALPITVNGLSDPKGSYSLDSDTSTFAISVGNQWPTQPSAYDYWEYTVNPDNSDAPLGHTIDEVQIHPWGGGYECYVSIYRQGTGWYTNTFDQAGGNLNIPYQWTGIDVGNDIPYVMKVNIPDAEPGNEKPISFNLPREYMADYVRITFHLPKDSGIGTYRYRSGIREFKVFNTVNMSYNPVEDVREAGQLTEPWTFAMASHPSHGYWIGDRDGNVYGYGDAFDGTVDSTTYVSAMATYPKGSGVYVLEESGRVHALGDAQHHGNYITPNFVYEGMPSNGEFLEKTTVRACDIASNYDGSGYWVIYTNGEVRGFGNVGGITYTVLPVTPTVQFTEAIRSIKTGRRHWLQLRGTGIVAHPKKMGFWASNGHGEIWAFGEAKLMNVVGSSGGVNYGGLNQRVYNKGLSTSFGVEGYLTSIEVTDDGEGLWLLFGDGHIAQFGSAVTKGPTRIGDLRWSAPGSISSDLPLEWQFFKKLLYELVRTPDGKGFWVLMADGSVGQYEAEFWGNPSFFGQTGIRWNEGNYSDYSDIVTDLLLWAGFLAYSDPGVDEKAFVYGNVESTGIMSDIALNMDQFDKKPVADAIKVIRQVVGYFMYVDEQGGANFVNPNWWRSGNFDLSGNRLYAKWEVDADGNSYPQQVIPTVVKDSAGQNVYVFSEQDAGAVPYIPVIDERSNLTTYSVTADGSGIRSQIIIGASEPNFYDKTDPTHGASNTAGGFNIYEPPLSKHKINPDDPYSPPLLRGIVRHSFKYNRRFTNKEEQLLMAELVDLYSWFSQRVGSLEAPADPSIGINDQIRIIERNTGDTYIHYVRAVKTSFDADSGKYTMNLDTNWLGDSDNWVITGQPGATYSPLSYALISKRIEEWALRNNKDYYGGLEHNFIPSVSFNMSFSPTMIQQGGTWEYSGSIVVSNTSVSNARFYLDDLSSWLFPVTVQIGSQTQVLTTPGYVDIGNIELLDSEIPVSVTGGSSSYGTASIAVKLTTASTQPVHLDSYLMVSASGQTQVSNDGVNPGTLPVTSGTNWYQTFSTSVASNNTSAISTALTNSITLSHEGGAFPYTPESNRYRLWPTVTSGTTGSNHIAPGDFASYLSDAWALAMRWHLATEEGSSTTTSMVEFGYFGMAALLRSTGNWVDITPTTPYGNGGAVAQVIPWFDVYGKTWGVNRAGKLNVYQLQNTATHGEVVGYSTANYNGTYQFGQPSQNSDGSTSRIMAAGYGAIKPYLAAVSEIRVPDPTKTANIMGLMWWVQARVVGPDAANSHYRLLPGLDILRSTGTSWDSTVDDDGGLVGRAVVLNQNWKYAVGTTCSASMLSNHPPTAQLNFTNIS